MKSMGWILSVLVAVGVLAPAPSAVAQSSKNHGGDIISEIAPLKRYRPDIQPRTFSYAKGELIFTPTEEETLKSVALRLRGTKDRVQLVSHAGDAEISRHEAVKMAYKRAMIIRNFLVRHGVDAKQVDVEALGAPKDGGPTDQVVMTALPAKF